MTEITSDRATTAQKPSGITPSTTALPQPTPQLQPTPTRTSPAHPVPAFLQPTPTDPNMRSGLLPRDHGLGRSASPTPAMPQPGAVPFLPKETGYAGTNPSSRCSSVNPNDTLPPTPNPGPETQPQPYPPQMKIPPLPVVRDTGKSTASQHEHEVRPTTHLPLDDTHEKKERVATTTTESVLLPTPTEHHNALPSRPAQAQGVEASYSAARRSGEMHPSGYKQNEGAIERPYYGGQEGGEGEETLLGKLGKWVEGINSKIVDTGIAGDVKGKGKE